MCLIKAAVVDVAQLVESQIVILVVVGSSPIVHPTKFLISSYSSPSQFIKIYSKQILFKYYFSKIYIMIGIPVHLRTFLDKHHRLFWKIFVLMLKVDIL
jgi:hypothetical protein